VVYGHFIIVSGLRIIAGTNTYMWEKITSEYRFYENKDLFAKDGLKAIVVILFIKSDSGEIKMYLKSIYEERGKNSILEELNKADSKK
jgi:hypothetical protein